MTDHAAAPSSYWTRWRLLALALCALVLAVFVGANAHLVYVSVTSQPACVPHLKSPEEGAGAFRAAKSSC